jgi:hypothetical protein
MQRNNLGIATFAAANAIFGIAPEKTLKGFSVDAAALERAVSIPPISLSTTEVPQPCSLVLIGSGLIGSARPKTMYNYLYGSFRSRTGCADY